MSVRHFWSEPKASAPTDVADRQPPRYLRGWFDKLDRLELVVVRRQVALRSRPLVAWLARGTNRLGDGWLYLVLPIVVVALFGRGALRAVLLAAMSVALGHLTYPLIKSHIARSRPARADPALSLLPPLDRYSCPSGHAMTSTAAFLPLGVAFPTLGLCLLPIWIALGWTRLVLGHHYPSDLIAGAVLGALWVALAALLVMPLLETSKLFTALVSGT